MKEDEFVKAWMEYRNQKQQSDIKMINHEIHPEAHYNHFGKRGSVDIHDVSLPDKNNWVTTDVFEIKSTSAIQNATGANEILRQFNKTIKYFYKDESNLPDEKLSSVRFELTFLPTKHTIEHVYENSQIYINATLPEIGFADSLTTPDDSGYPVKTRGIVFRMPDADNIMPVHINASFIDTWNDILSQSEANPEVYNRIIDVVG